MVSICYKARGFRLRGFTLIFCTGLVVGHEEYCFTISLACSLVNLNITFVQKHFDGVADDSVELLL